MNSKSMLKALQLHLVDGFDEEKAVICAQVQQSNFNRDLSKLNSVACVVEKIKELDWKKFKQENLQQ